MPAVDAPARALERGGDGGLHGLRRVGQRQKCDAEEGGTQGAALNRHGPAPNLDDFDAQRFSVFQPVALTHDARALMHTHEAEVEEAAGLYVIIDGDRLRYGSINESRSPSRTQNHMVC